MKKTLFVFVMLFSGILIQAQEQQLHEYRSDTIWLKTGLMIPCQIVEDSSSLDYVYINFYDSYSKLDRTIIEWEQIIKASKNGQGYYPHTTVYRIDLTNGTSFSGVLLSSNDSVVVLQLRDIGFITINRSKFDSMIPLNVSEEVKKSFWFKNPHATRLLFAPTAIPLRKGEAYYQNIYIVGNMFNYGIINNLSIGGGFDFITMFTNISGEWSPILNLNLKTGFQVADNLHIGAGGIVANIPETGAAGLLYGLGTIGTYNNNATLGLGWGFVDGSFQKAPFIMVGGMVRVSEKLWLVSENWIAPVGNDNEYYGVYSYGLRFAANRIAVDLAFINNPDIVEAIFIGIPFVDFVIKIGR